MRSRIRFSTVLIATLLACNAVIAQGDNVRRDEKALDILQSMSAHTAKLDKLVIEGTSFTDARLPAGLMVSNPTEIKVTIDRPGSMHISNFDGHEKKEIYFHEGRLTVFSSGSNFYGQAEIPEEIEAAAEYALEELDIEAPMMDLLYRDVPTQLMSSDDEIVYLTDKSRIDGMDCHHIAIRGSEIDLQLWVAEGDRPVLRKIMMTSKWEGGAPRYVAIMRWDTAPRVTEEMFIFKAPEGSIDIGFTRDTNEQ
ncbi:MAG: DUF2092 domain-containing protein [Halioglobus sp.]